MSVVKIKCKSTFKGLVTCHPPKECSNRNHGHVCVTHRTAAWVHMPVPSQGSAGSCALALSSHDLGAVGTASWQALDSRLPAGLGW